MKMVRLFRLMMITYITAAICVAGCKKHQPDGLPKLMPCEITVIDIDGTPLTDAVIRLRSIGEPVPWSIMGKTDENGVANISVNAQYKGSPAGQFRVLVTKVAGFNKTEKIPQFPPNVFVDINAELAYYINPVYSNEESSPLEIVVADGEPTRKTLTIDKSPKEQIKTKKR